MGIEAVLEDMEEVFLSSTRDPIVVNDHNEKDFLEKYAFIKVASQVFVPVPTCQCQRTQTQANLGQICEFCGTVVEPSVDHEFGAKLWIRAPKDVCCLVLPEVWLMLTKLISMGNFNTLRYFTDRSFVSEVAIPTAVLQAEQDLRRGYNNFFSFITQSLETLYAHRVIKTENMNLLRAMIQKYKVKTMFPSYLLIPNKSLAILQKTHSGTYRDPTYDALFDSIQIMLGIDHESNDYRVAQKEQHTAKAMEFYANFHLNYQKKIIQPKPGLIRKKILGARTHFSWRTVISSITMPHLSDEIHVPWAVAITVLRLHLINYMVRDGFDIASNCDRFLNEHVNKYHPYLDKLFQRMIADSDTSHVYPLEVAKDRPGIMTTMVRNPSMHLGSLPLVRFSRVKTDVTDKSTSLSDNITKQMNADFDGDQCNFRLTLDKWTARAMRYMLPHRVILDLSNHRSAGPNLMMSVNSSSALSNLVAHEKSKMRRLYGR